MNNFIGKSDKTIVADGIGYYDYLPSIFIHKDILRKNKTLDEDSILYKRVNNMRRYLPYNNHKVNKYPCGTALLQLPFFTYTYLTTPRENNYNDGYQKPFHKTILASTIFYLFLSILFLKKILLLYDIKKYNIAFIQLLLVLGTSVTHYANVESSFSHIYSLFAITAFIYFTKLYLIDNKIKHFLIACLLLGLIFIIRQPNIIIILFVPFLAETFSNLKASIAGLYNKKSSFILGVFLFILIASIQLILWYIQTGSFLVYSYQGEGFNFLNPYFFSILFSYKKGLFVYTPVLLISLVSIIWLIKLKKYYLVLTWVSFFFILTYIFSSWWTWFYGCSYGLRVYIDFYVIFFIPIALMINQISLIYKLIIITIASFTIPVNIIQTYQYKNYILHWNNMSKEKYWKVFLKTDDKYKGLLWKMNYNLNKYSNIAEFNIGDIISTKNSYTKILKINNKDNNEINKTRIIQIHIDHLYPKNSDTKIIISVKNTNNKHSYFWDKRSLLHFHETEFNEFQTGVFNFDINSIDDNEEKTISISVFSGDKVDTLENVKINFLSLN